MFAEIVDGEIVQIIKDDDTTPVTTVDGTQYPGNWTKVDIPGVVIVADPGIPDPSLFSVVSISVAMIDGNPTRIYTTTPVAQMPTTVEANSLIHSQLASLDLQTIRPLRAIMRAQVSGGVADQRDVNQLAALNTQADALRAQLVKP